MCDQPGQTNCTRGVYLSATGILLSAEYSNFPYGRPNARTPGALGLVCPSLVLFHVKQPVSRRSSADFNALLSASASGRGSPATCCQSFGLLLACGHRGIYQENLGCARSYYAVPAHKIAAWCSPAQWEPAGLGPADFVTTDFALEEQS